MELVLLIDSLPVLVRLVAALGRVMVWLVAALGRVLIRVAAAAIYLWKWRKLRHSLKADDEAIGFYSLDARAYNRRGGTDAELGQETERNVGGQRYDPTISYR